MAEAPKHIRRDAQADPVGGQGKGRRYPWLLRLLAVLVIGASVIEAVVFSVLFALGGLAILDGELLRDLSGTTAALTVTYLAVLGITDILQVSLGIRLLRNLFRRAALVCNVLISLKAVALVLNVMLLGLSGQVWATLASIAVLFALETYSDPTLRRERIQRFEEQEEEVRLAQEAGVLGRDLSGEGYITLNFFNMFWIFTVCSFVGLVLEVLWHGIVVEPGIYQNRAGLLYGPFSPIYGFGGLLMTIALNRSYRSSPVLVFLVAGMIGAAFEYFVGWWMESSFGIVAWDYSGTFLNIDGRTNFMFFCMWGLLGVLWIRIALPRLLALINRIPWNWHYAVTTLAATLMLVNGGLTVAALDCWYQRQAGLMEQKQQSFIDEFCNERYDDAFMAYRFQSMSMHPESATRVR